MNKTQLSREELRQELFNMFRSFRNNLNLVWDSAHLYKNEEELQEKVKSKESEYYSLAIDLINTKVLEGKIEELTNIRLGKFTNHLFEHKEYCVPTKDIDERINELQKMKEIK